MSWILAFCAALYVGVVLIITRKLLYPGVNYLAPMRLPSWLNENADSIRSVKLRYFLHSPFEESRICILLHGLGDSSEALLKEAELLKSMGFGILMIDLLGHGGSSLRATSFGRNESTYALELVTKLGLENRIDFLWGRSVGAAIAIFISSSLPSVKAVILDGIFKTEINSISKHAYKVKKFWPAFIFLPFVFLILYFLKMRNRSLQTPLSEIEKSNLPILFITGSEDIGAGPEVQRELLRASQNELSRLVVVPGAKHNQCFRARPEAYLDWLNSFVS